MCSRKKNHFIKCSVAIAKSQFFMDNARQASCYDDRNRENDEDLTHTHTLTQIQITVRYRWMFLKYSEILLESIFINNEQRLFDTNKYTLPNHDIN